MRETIYTLTFPLESATIREHVTDRETGEDATTHGTEALDQLRDMLSGCYVDAYVGEDGTVHLGIVKRG